jgi:hypothetical protein
LSDFSGLGFYRHIFFLKTQISNIIKILPVGALLFHAGGQTHTHTDGWTDGRTDRQAERYDEVPNLFFFVLFGIDINYPDN